MPTAAEIRPLFPAALSAPYLGTNGYGLMPTPTHDALARAVDGLHERGYAAHHRLEAGIDAVRSQVAALLHAHDDEVAFVRNTADGLGFLADALPWRDGDEVLVFAAEYGTVVYPFVGAQPRGGPTVRIAPTDPSGVVTPYALLQAIGPKTRAVVLSWVRYDTGARADLGALGQMCAIRGIWFVVDAIQGLGVFPVDVHAARITALAAGTHKWLCGLAGLGVLYVDAETVGRLRPVRTGLGAVVEARHRELPTPETFKLRSDLGRIEDGASNELAVAALGASLTVLASVTDAVDHVRRLTDHLADRWRSIGGTVVSPRDGEQWSGIVALEPPPGRSLDDVLGRAWANKVTVGPIRGRLVPSVHVYTSQLDVDAFVDAVAP